MFVFNIVREAHSYKVALASFVRERMTLQFRAKFTNFFNMEPECSGLGTDIVAVRPDHHRTRDAPASTGLVIRVLKRDVDP